MTNSERTQRIEELENETIEFNKIIKDTIILKNARMTEVLLNEVYQDDEFRSLLSKEMKYYAALGKISHLLYLLKEKK